LCPDCGRQLCRWGGYWRWFRGSGTQRLWIRRGRCPSCRRSHALLPDFLLERRLDEVEVIGRALVLGIVVGLGMRKVADRVGVPMTTARDWRRRFRVRAPGGSGA
jgi:transposase-like protein